MNKIVAFTVIMMLLTASSRSQEHVVKPLDELGWTLENFVLPDNLTELDTGQVDYLITLKTDGRVKHVTILSNSFNRKAERIWRRLLVNATFARTDWNHPIQTRGSFFIGRQHCSSEGSATEDQIKLFQISPEE